MTTKTALITGASQGIGREIALALATEGYQLILLARSQDKLSSLKAEITQINPQISPDIFALDIRKPENITQIVNQIYTKYQRLDVLVNNAGVWLQGSSGVEQQAIENLFNTNFIAPYSLMNQVIPIMKQQQSGYIINISSRSGKIGFAGSGLYSASKFALNGLSESLYRELAPLGIKVTNICPSWVNTAMAKQANSPLACEDMIQTSDIVATVHYLLSLSASACVKELVLECSVSIK